MKITIAPTHEGKSMSFPNPIVTIELPSDDLSIDRVIDEMLIPALTAWGFSNARENLSKYKSPQ